MGKKNYTIVPILSSISLADFNLSSKVTLLDLLDVHILSMDGCFSIFRNSR